MRYRILSYICLSIGMASVIATTSLASSVETKKHSASSNLWVKLARHFQLDHNLNQAAVQKEIHFLQHRQDYVSELANNATPYLYYVYSQTQLHNMPAEIALIPMVESDYNPFGVSHTGAIGLWQIMPGTASALKLKMNWWYDGRRSVINSTQAALKHLQYLHSAFGNWLLAVAAYNSGNGTVRAAIRYNKSHHLPTDFWHLHLPTETKLYVPKLLGLAAVIANSNHYGLQLTPIKNHPYFDAIKMKGPIELSKIATLSSTSIKMVHQLNPAFRRWITTPSGSYWLLLPVGRAQLVQNTLSNSRHYKHTQWIHYHIAKGDNLSQLASRYHTTTAWLKNINHLNNSLIHIGQEILIPFSYQQTIFTAENKQDNPIA